jgi:glycosyltransferase involved in cell wall biosynthesis
MLTILCATHNGAQTLPDLLEALGKVRPPAGGWKLVIVDNVSTDATRTIVESYGGRLPVTYLYTEKRGQNAARNVGLGHLEGDLVVFTDDDVTPEPDWLEQLRAAADSHPDYAMFGGTIVPRWAVTPPDWILRSVDHGVAFTATDPEQAEGPILANLVWSPNMAIRRAIFDAGRRFDEDVGPNGASYAMGSETDFTTRLAEDGYKAWFCRRAVVHHFVRSSQFDRAWLLGRAVRFGRGMYRRQLRSTPAPGPLAFGVPRYLVRMIIAQAFRVGLAALQTPARRFTQEWELRYLIGCAIEARRHFTNKG